MKKARLKAFATALLCVAVVLGACACASQSSAPSGGAASSSPSAAASASSSSNASSSASTSAPSSSAASSSSSVKAVNVDWTAKDYEQVYKDGYHLLQTIRVSPWIDASKTDYLNAAWSEVSKGKVFPTLSQFNASSLGEDQVAYAVGTLSVNNVTDSFSISSTSNVATYFDMSLKQPGGYGVDAAMLVYYDDKMQLCHTNGASFQANNGALMAKMTGDSWGPVPFVIVMENRKTPNEPNGKDLAEYRFSFGDGESFEVGAA